MNDRNRSLNRLKSWNKARAALDPGQDRLTELLGLFIAELSRHRDALIAGGCIDHEFEHLYLELPVPMADELEKIDLCVHQQVAHFRITRNSQGASPSGDPPSDVPTRVPKS